MGALDLGHVHEAGAAADDTAAGEVQLGYVLYSALVERARPVPDSLASHEQIAYGGMLLEALELLEGAQVWVRVIQRRLRSIVVCTKYYRMLPRAVATILCLKLVPRSEDL